MDLISRLNAVLFGPVLVFAVFGAGVFLLVRTRAFFIVHPVRCARAVFSGERAGGVSPFAALCTALAGTLGVGNIVGVAGAIAVGGAGSVFWMWVSAIAAMTLKFSEVALGIMHREPTGDGGFRGGAPYYIRDAANKPRLAKLFAALCLAASFTLGNAVQSRAAAETAELTLGIHPAVAGGVIAAICMAVSFGGLKKIAAFTSRMIPFLTCAFIVMSAISIIAAADRVPAVMREIVCSAFSARSAAGGTLGFVTSRAIRYGIARGIASNEAGCGTAPTAHAAADTDSPVRQGLWGVIEVAVDTVILCTLTALVILVNGTENAGDGIAPVLDGFARFFGALSGRAVCFCVFFFALSTVLCWSFYGVEAVRFLTEKKKARTVYLALFFISVVPFSVTDTVFLWELSDLVTALMTSINVTVLISQSGYIARAVRKFFGRSNI